VRGEEAVRNLVSGLVGVLSKERRRGDGNGAEVTRSPAHRQAAGRQVGLVDPEDPPASSPRRIPHLRIDRRHNSRSTSANPKSRPGSRRNAFPSTPARARRSRRSIALKPSAVDSAFPVDHEFS
jgi:hypothetical protein